MCRRTGHFIQGVRHPLRGSKTRFSPIAFGNQTISHAVRGRFQQQQSALLAQRFTALRPRFAAGLPLSVQSLQCERTLPLEKPTADDLLNYVFIY